MMVMGMFGIYDRLCLLNTITKHVVSKSISLPNGYSQVNVKLAGMEGKTYWWFHLIISDFWLLSKRKTNSLH